MSMSFPVSREMPQRVGLDLRIETPENVVLTYQLAGPAVRCLAYLIDLLLRLVGLFCVALVLTPFGFFLPGLAGGVVLLALFFVEWGYYFVGETLFKGRSIGKAAFGLRVIQEPGHPISAWPSLLRNLLRVADALPVWFILYGDAFPLFYVLPIYGPGFVAMLLSPRFQRIGDLAARTVVIAERRVVLPREPVIIEKIDPLSRDELGSFVPDARTLALIEEFLGRRHVLSHERGHALAAVLAGPLARRLSYRGDPQLVERYPMAFLARVYVTFLRPPDEDEEQDVRPLRRPRSAVAGVAS